MSFPRSWNRLLGRSNSPRVLAAWALILLAQPLAVAGQQPADGPGDGLPALVEQLGAPIFSGRMAAAAQLSSLQPDSIRRLADLATQVESAESAAQIVRILQRYYLDDAPDEARAAYDALEALLQTDRSILRENATWVLLHYWQQRQNYVVHDLRHRGALVVLPAAINATGSRNFATPDPGARLQVFITEEWDASATAQQLLERLPGLAAQLMARQTAAGGRQAGRRTPAGRSSPPRVEVFLVNGHSLDPQQAGRLKGGFGDHVQERGNVMMGITAKAGIAGQGCVVQEVIQFGSARAAGITAQDKITRLESATIDSFEDLVQELQKFKAGDTVSVSVIRGFGTRPGNQETEILQVELKSWADYVRAINAAARQKLSPQPERVQ